MATRTRVSVFLLPASSDKQAQERCIRSVLNQSHRNLELLLPENAQLNAETFRDSRIRTFALNNITDAPGILTHLSREAEGSYLALADPNAWYHKHRLELQLRYFERYPETDVLGTSMKLSNDYLNVPQVSDVATMRFLLLFSPMLNHRTIMLRRRVAETCSTMPHQKHSWDSLFLELTNNVVIGLLPLVTTFTGQSLEVDDQAFEYSNRACTELFGTQALELLPELWVHQGEHGDKGLYQVARKAHILLNAYKETGRPFAPALKKALATALMLRAQQNQKHRVLFERQLFFWWRHSALDLKSKWKLALL